MRASDLGLGSSHGAVVINELVVMERYISLGIILYGIPLISFIFVETSDSSHPLLDRSCTGCAWPNPLSPVLRAKQDPQRRQHDKSSIYLESIALHMSHTQTQWRHISTSTTAALHPPATLELHGTINQNIDSPTVQPSSVSLNSLHSPPPPPPPPPSQQQAKHLYYSPPPQSPHSPPPPPPLPGY